MPGPVDLSSGFCTDSVYPDMWFSDAALDKEEAAIVCAQCPVARECRAGAVERGERWGIWGGIDFTTGRPPTGRGSASRNRARREPALVIPDPLGHRRGIVERVDHVVRFEQLATLADVAERLGYKDAENLRDTLRRRGGEEGVALIRLLDPTYRPLELVRAQAVSRAWTAADNARRAAHRAARRAAGLERDRTVYEPMPREVTA